MSRPSLVPTMATVQAVTDETSSGDVKTFLVEIADPDERQSFRFLPGQCAMVSVFGVGESMLSITSSPDQPGPLEFTAKRVGRVTSALHEAQPGSGVGLRGPFGNHFPFEEWDGKDLLFVGGGVGLAPLRSLVSFCLARRERFGDMRILYGARTPGDLCFKRDILASWPDSGGLRIDLTVDAADEEWRGEVGTVPDVLRRRGVSPRNTVAVTCGPPVMIRFVLCALEELGFDDAQVVTTLEFMMQCGIGKCGRCNIGHRYVCVDGPVFKKSELRELPHEY